MFIDFFGKESCVTMRKDHLLPGLAAVGGALGFVLRRWQWAAYDPEAQLFSNGHPAGLLLLLLTGVLALAFLLLTRDLRAPEEELPWACPLTGWMTAMTAAALLFALGGLLSLLEGMSQLPLSRAAPDTHPIAYPIALLLCGGLTMLSAGSSLMLGRACYRGRRDPALSMLVLAPAFAALAWVFACHMEHSTDPILWNYGPVLAAAILLQLAHYEAAAAFHRGPHPRVWAFFALTGSAVGVMALGDGGTSARTPILAAMILSALAGVWPMLRICYGPPLPPPGERMPVRAQEDEDDDDDRLDF